MSVEFGLSDEEVVKLQNSIKEYASNAEKKITEYLHGKGYDRFEKSVKMGMPVSGRKAWGGKKPKKTPAKISKSVRDMMPGTNLSVTVGTQKNYQYLYFPNDGTNTKHHAGNQQFFEKGVENQTSNVVNDMLDLLKFEN